MKNTSRQTFPDYSKFVGIPYEDMNCWDLAVAFYREIMGIELSNIYTGPTPSREATRGHIHANVHDFHKVDAPEFGDIIILKIHGIESHISIFVGRNKMLHTLEKTGSVVDSMIRWEKIIVGYYRTKRTS